MTCDAMLELMSAALDNELTANEKAQLDRHLAQCDHCRALFDDLSSIHDACADMEVTPPPALREQILQNLPVQDSSVHKGRVVPIHWRRWTAMAASFALVALAAWHLPQLAVSPSTGNTTPPSQTESAGSGSNVARDEERSVSTTAGTEESSPADLVAPTPAPAALLPDSVQNDNVVPAQPSSDSPKSVQKAVGKSSSEVLGTIDATSFADTAYGGAAAGADQGQENDNALPLMASARMAFSSQKQAALTENGGEAEASVFDITELDTEVPELHPELADGENVPATLFVQDAVSPVYCGVLTLPSGIPLNDYSAQEQSNGEIWYELPCNAFFALLEELENSGMDFTIRMTGSDVSSAAPNGLVVVLP